MVSTEKNYRKPLHRPPATPTRGAERFIIRPGYYVPEVQYQNMYLRYVPIWFELNLLE